MTKEIGRAPPKHRPNPAVPKTQGWAKIMNKEFEKESALDEQVGGGHYKDLKIQPVEYITANDLGWCEGNVVKYITRHSIKGGKEDIDKVIHYCQLLKEIKYDG